jgi:glycosyltransferase involved in cell wall biosynthesis
MSSLQPAVSVVIPCFNQGATLDEAVDSVLAQTFTDFEIVIVNDGSTDSFTNELLARYHRPKTRVVATSNQGLGPARNTAIRHSTGKYILPLDADDKIGREYLELAVRILEANPDVIIVHCNVDRFGAETGLVELQEFSRKIMMFRNLIFCCAFFRRSDYDASPGYRTNVHAYEDWDMWLSLLDLRPDSRVLKIPLTLFHYRVQPSSMLNSMSEAMRRRSRTNLYLNQRRSGTGSAMHGTGERIPRSAKFPGVQSRRVRSTPGCSD